MAELHRVIYCSRNTIPGAPEAVAAQIATILDTSRRNNARDGVTGGLLFNRNCFAQVLEGPLETIEATFERIQCDPRHSEVTVLGTEQIASRDFADWSMAFAGASTDDNPLTGIVLEEAFEGRTKSGSDVLDLLRGIIVRDKEWLAIA